MIPTSSQERYEFLDVLRGFALIGIISANMVLYSLYLWLPESSKLDMNTHSLDRVLDFLELTLIEGKFYTIFSVLFGIGFAILVSRARTKEQVFHRFFLRRLFVLFLIGAAHAILVWHCDILVFYAFCGALLLPFAKAKDRTIITAALLALLAPIPIKLVGGIPSELFNAPRDMLFERFGFSLDTLIDTWTRGSPGEIVRLNLSKWFDQAHEIITSGMIFKIYGCFLLGFVLGRKEIYKNLERYRPIIKRTAIWGIAIGLPLNVIFASTFDSESWISTIIATVAILPLSASYASLVGLIWLEPNGPKQLQLFAPVGRMALTNYVGQSVICTLIFYGTGLALGGTMGPTFYLAIGFAVYLVQVAVSRLWLDRFRFGPLEWIWRMLTYGKWIPLVKRAVV